MTTLLGIGIDGGNLLGFLAALGAQEHLERARPDLRARLSWRREIAWRPVWYFEGRISEDEACELLAERLRARAKAPEFSFDDDLPAPVDEFRKLLKDGANVASADDRDTADFALAFGTELYPAEKRDKNKGKPRVIQDTAFRTMSGSGHQRFLKTIRQLAERMNAKRVRAALFESWRYEDERLGLRFDPNEDRRYALRSSDPTTDPPRTVWAANMLAAEGLRFFPTAIRGRSLATTGFRGLGANQTFHWPVWEPPLGGAVIRALLDHPDIVRDPLPEERLRAMGIAEVFRASRFTEGKYRNFSPSEALLG